MTKGKNFKKQRHIGRKESEESNKNKDRMKEGKRKKARRMEG